MKVTKLLTSNCGTPTSLWATPYWTADHSPWQTRLRSKQLWSSMTGFRRQWTSRCSLATSPMKCLCLNNLWRGWRWKPRRLPCLTTQGSVWSSSFVSEKMCCPVQNIGPHYRVQQAVLGWHQEGVPGCLCTQVLSLGPVHLLPGPMQKVGWNGTEVLQQSIWHNNQCLQDQAWPHHYLRGQPDGPYTGWNEHRNGSRYLANATLDDEHNRVLEEALTQPQLFVAAAREIESILNDKNGLPQWGFHVISINGTKENDATDVGEVDKEEATHLHAINTILKQRGNAQYQFRVRVWLERAPRQFQRDWSHYLFLL